MTRAVIESQLVLALLAFRNSKDNYKLLLKNWGGKLSTARICHHSAISLEVCDLQSEKYL